MNITRSAPLDLFSALQTSHGRLSRLFTSIPAADVTQQAYPTEWSIAQVAPHLGSQAETFQLSLAAGLNGTDAPGLEQIQPIWDRWNAKNPADQVSDCLVSDQAFLEAVDALTDEQRHNWRLSMMGAEQDLSGLLRMRLIEHLLHTWDIEVTGNPAATLPGDAAALVVDQLPLIVRYTAKPSTAQQVRVHTIKPELFLHLSLNPDGSQLKSGDEPPAEADQTPEQSIQLPTEAFVRLVYGRLDADHTPQDVGAETDLLNALRAALPGA